MAYSIGQRLTVNSLTAKTPTVYMKGVSPNSLASFSRQELAHIEKGGSALNRNSRWSTAPSNDEISLQTLRASIMA